MPSAPVRLQVVDERVDHLGRRSRRLPLVQLLVQEEPLDEAVGARVGGRQLHQRPEREGLRLDRVVVPEPRPVLRAPRRSPARRSSSPSP